MPSDPFGMSKFIPTIEVPTPPDALRAALECFADDLDTAGHLGWADRLRELWRAALATPSPAPLDVERLAAWFHRGGWVEERVGCTQNVSGLDRTTGEPYFHVTDWQGCLHRDEHETMAHSALAAIAAAYEREPERPWHCASCRWTNPGDRNLCGNCAEPRVWTVVE